MGKLTFKTIQALSIPGLYGDGGTLFLRVTPGGTKQWVQRLVIRTKRQDLGLGGFPLTGLAEARDKAFHNRKIARNGGDPLRERRQRDHVPTFADALAQVIALHEGTWKDKGRTREQWQNSMKHYVLPSLGRLRVSDIEARDVLQIVGPLWTEKNETAMKIKRRVSVVMDWAVMQGYRIDNCVTALKGNLPKTDTLKGHYKMIPHEDVAAALAKTRTSAAYPSTIACFEFAVLTASRSQEARGATWEEINLGSATWDIPGTRTKTGKAFRVPLSRRAVDLLEEQKARTGHSPFVFPSPRGGILSDATISKMVRENGINGVPHAIARACFRSWCADVNVSREVAEACLAHVVKGVEGAYQRSDLFERRRSVMQKWADYIIGAPRADVIPLHG